MTKTKKKRLITIGISLVLIILTCILIGWATNQFQFLDGDEEEIFVSYTATSERESWVQSLSEQIGIDLDPALEKHAALIDRRNRLVVCPGTLVFTQTEEGWFRGSVDCSRSDLSGRTLPENPVYIYTGVYEDEDYIAHVALLEEPGREASDYDALEYELIVQLQPVSDVFPIDKHELAIRSAPTTTGRLFLPLAKPSIYLRSSEAGFWVERMREKSNHVVHSVIPALITSTTSGRQMGKVDRIQYWCIPIYHDESASHYRIQPEIYLDGELWANLSFWYPDSLYQ